MSPAFSELEAAAARHEGLRLRDPAASDALDAAEFPGCPRPVPVREIWGVHDGSVGVVFPDLEMRLLSLQEALDTHQEMLQTVVDEDLVGQGVAQDGSKPEVFTAGWIPIAAEEERLLCIDLDPEDGSRVGQVIIVHTTEGSHGRMADDLESLWVQAAESLSEG